MNLPEPITLQRATESDGALLANLLELYIHDLSEAFAIEVGPDGRFGYDRLAAYWAEPERRFAYIIRNGPAIAGFALACVGSPASDDPTVLDVAEFFVLRRHRRLGVGQRAAHLLWDSLPGSWIVRVSTGNPRGLAFWPAAIQLYTQGDWNEKSLPGNRHPWKVFSLRTRTSVAG
ncbi:MAG TPA: GNAT family N-acetyltransferase [Polyangiales bacterium]|nr:GNAT family N-acetyltransferase [Polyangiales bacterium]